MDTKEGGLVMSSEEWYTRYQEELRKFFCVNAKIVRIVPSSYTLDSEPPDGNYNVSSYGWQNYTATEHIRGRAENKWQEALAPCPMVIPEGAEVHERVYSQFSDTISPNSETHGLNVYPVSCSCGTVKDAYARWEGTVSDLILAISGQAKYTSAPIIKF